MDTNLKDLSIVMIAFNEEKNLLLHKGVFLRVGEVIIVDSFSTDRTPQLAEELGAKVYQRRFDDFASHKNFALSKSTKKWVLSLDADEQVSDELLDEISNIMKSSSDKMSSLASSNNQTFVRIKRRQVFLGKRLRFGRSCDAPIRLFLAGSSRFKNAIHESIEITPEAKVITTQAALLHYSYQNIEDYFSRFNRYTTLVAKNHFANDSKMVPTKWIVSLRFFWEFISRYIIKLGFLDGYEGFVFCLYGSVYAFTKYAKLLELHSNSETNAK